MLPMLLFTLGLIPAEPDALYQLEVRAREGEVRVENGIPSIVSYANRPEVMQLTIPGLEKIRTMPTEQEVRIQGNLFCIESLFRQQRCDFQNFALSSTVNDLPHILRAQDPFIPSNGVRWYILLDDSSHKRLYIGVFIIDLSMEQMYERTDTRKNVAEALLRQIRIKPQLEMHSINVVYEALINVSSPEQRTAASAIVSEFAFGVPPPLSNPPVTSPELERFLVNASEHTVFDSYKTKTGMLAFTTLSDESGLDVQFTKSVTYNGGVIKLMRTHMPEENKTMVLRNFTTPKDLLAYASSFRNGVISADQKRIMALGFDPKSRTVQLTLQLLPEVSVVQALRYSHQGSARNTLDGIAMLRMPAGTREEQDFAARTIEVLASGVPDMEYLDRIPQTLYKHSFDKLKMQAGADEPPPNQVLSQPREISKVALLVLVLIAALIISIGVLIVRRRRKRRKDGANRTLSLSEDGLTDEERRAMLQRNAEVARKLRLGARRARTTSGSQSIVQTAKPEVTEAEIVALEKEIQHRLMDPNLPTAIRAKVEAELEHARDNDRLKKKKHILEYTLGLFPSNTESARQ